MAQENKLLTRDNFRESVLRRDGGRCALCQSPGTEAIHVLDRQLWADGGFYLGNGATVCARCRARCESTEVSVEQLREAARISEVLLPPSLHAGSRYDRWGNPYLPSGRRVLGQLGFEPSVRQALAPAWGEFTERVKLPRTLHLPWSPSADPDDRFVAPEDLAWLRSQPVVVLEKRDGEQTTLYKDEDGIHARSVEGYDRHESRARMRALHAEVRSNIPDAFRVCGENVDAYHSVRYHDLCDDAGTPARFFVFSVWDRDLALSWDETVEWSLLIGLAPINELYRGPYDERLLRGMASPSILKKSRKPGGRDDSEGYVVRPLGGFRLSDYPRAVLKCRVLGVAADLHWRWGARYEPNCVRGSCAH